MRARYGPFVLTIALLLLVVYVFRDRLSAAQLVDQVRKLDLVYLALSAIFLQIGISGAAIRYRHILARMTGAQVSLSYVVLQSNFAFACGYLAPMSVAADVLRVAFTKRYLQINLAHSASLVVIDKLLGLICVAMCALAFVPLKLAFGISRELIAVETISIIAVFGALALAYSGSRAIARAAWLPGWATSMGGDLRLAATKLLNRRDIAVFGACLVLQLGGFGIGALLIASAVGLNVGAAVLLILSPTILLAQNAPMFYAGFGAREAILLVAFPSNLQIEASVALSFSVMIGIMFLISALPAALAFLFRAIEVRGGKDGHKHQKGAQ